MGRPPRWSGLPALPGCFSPGCRPAPAYHRRRRPGRRARPWLPGTGRMQGRTGGRTPRGLLHGLGNAARHIPGPLVEQGVVPHYQEGVVVLFQDGPELDGGEGPPHYQLDRAAVQPAEDARADAGDKEDPELLKVWVAVKGPGMHILGGDEGSWETAGRSSIFMIRLGGLRGY
jgi:hypothetical protein